MRWTSGANPQRHDEPWEINMVRAFLAAPALLGATSSAMAAGNEDIAEGCKVAVATGRAPAPNVAFAAGFCAGIVEGTLWSLPRTDFCLPNDATTGQGLKVLVKYTDYHPEELHERTALLATRAFVKAWPCSHDSEKPTDESFRKR